MKKRYGLVLLLAWGCIPACGGGDQDSDEGNESDEAVLVVDAIEFDLDAERLLSSLTDDEIRGACDGMVDVFDDADAGVACQIVAAAEETSADCDEALAECLEDPSDALDATNVRAAPAPVDCSAFNAALVADCDFPVSLLEECVNALAQSVVPAAQATRCSEAAEFDDVDAAQSKATQALGTDYIMTCIDLLACEDLVGALLSGDGNSGGE